MTQRWNHTRRKAQGERFLLLAGAVDLDAARTLWEDESAPVNRRCLAARALGLLAKHGPGWLAKGVDGVPALESARQRGEQDAQRRRQAEPQILAEDKMRALGVQSVPAVLLILKDKAQSQERREAAAEILGGLRHRVAVETLVEVLCEGEQRLSWLCMSALTDIRSRKGSHRLMEIVRGAYPLQARQEAIYTLWHLNEVRAEGLFIQLSARVADEEEYSRDMATEALGNTHWRRATQKAISKRLFDPSVSVRYSALCAAARVRNEPHPDLMSALQAKLSDPDQVDSNRVIATFAAEILEHISLRRAGQRIY